jgi:hypothetical protein
LREELGINLSGGELRLAWSGTLPFESRQDTVDIWEAPVENVPKMHVAGCEVIWAGWVPPATALKWRLLPHVATYLTKKPQIGAGPA